MDMDELKSILDKMIAENIIKNIGVNGKESFSIVEEKIISSDTASTNTQTYSENIGEDIANLENFINANTLFKSYIDSLNNALCNADDTNQSYSAYQKERNNLTRLSFEEHEKSYKTFMYSKDDKKLWEKIN